MKVYNLENGTEGFKKEGILVMLNEGWDRDVPALMFSVGPGETKNEAFEDSDDRFYPVDKPLYVSYRIYTGKDVVKTEKFLTYGFRFDTKENAGGSPVETIRIKRKGTFVEVNGSEDQLIPEFEFKVDSFYDITWFIQNSEEEGSEVRLWINKKLIFEASGTSTMKPADGGAGFLRFGLTRAEDLEEYTQLYLCDQIIISDDPDTGFDQVQIQPDQPRRESEPAPYDRLTQDEFAILKELLIIFEENAQIRIPKIVKGLNTKRAFLREVAGFSRLLEENLLEK